MKESIYLTESSLKTLYRFFGKRTFFVCTIISGFIWWLVAGPLGGFLFDIPLTLFASLITAIIIGYSSRSFYRRRSSGHLLWFAPLSLYFAIAFFAAILVGCKAVLSDSSVPHAACNSARLIELTLAMWWRVIFDLRALIAIVPLSFVNHKLLRQVYHHSNPC